MNIISVLLNIFKILLFIIGNYYIGIKGWQLIGRYIPFINKNIYWMIIATMVLIHGIFRLGTIGIKVFSSNVTNILILIGAYWLVAFQFSVMLFIIIDVFNFINRKYSFLHINKYLYFTEGIIVLTVVIALLFFGTLNGRKINIVHYHVNIQKESKGLNKLHAIVLSDIHIGNSIKTKELHNIVRIINDLNPDIVFITGDILDDKIEPLLDIHCQQILKRLGAKYGVYGVLGNHDTRLVERNNSLYTSKGERIKKDIIYYLGNSEVKIIRDNYIKIKDSFYIVGRDDISIKSFGYKKRKSLKEIIKGIDKSLPIILLDHRPINIKEAHEMGIDLQVSGHTHGGQIFPEGLINKLRYGINKGYLKKDGFNLIVSSGIGTWGAPIRIGSKGEIVSIIITFSNKNIKTKVPK
jgi:hypothetical protein